MTVKVPKPTQLYCLNNKKIPPNVLNSKTSGNYDSHWASVAEFSHLTIKRCMAIWVCLLQNFLNPRYIKSLWFLYQPLSKILQNIIMSATALNLHLLYSLNQLVYNFSFPLGVPANQPATIHTLPFALCK